MLPITESDIHDPARVESLCDWFRLEQRKKGGSFAMPANQLEKPAFREGLHILLVEDNAVNQTVATGLLRKMRHSVVTADDGREALHLLTQGVFDLILMDVQMPVMDGITATRKIREKEIKNQSRMPIIAVTAHVQTDDRNRCIEAGMDGYIPKPIDPAALAGEIESVLSRMEAERRSAKRIEEQIQSNGLEWDVTRTLTIFGWDTITLRTVVGQYLKSIPAEMTELRQALALGSTQTLASTANCLKGEVGYLAIPLLSNRVCELEATARSGDLQGAGRVMAALEPDISAVLASIEKANLNLEKGLTAELVPK